MLDKLKEIWENFNFAKKTITICIISSFFFWVFFLSPKISELREVKLEAVIIEGRLHQERLKLNNARREVQEINVYKQRFEDLDKDLNIIQSSLISKTQLLNLTNVLTFKEDLISYISFSTDSIIEENLYKVLPFEIKIEATYLLLGEYLKYIENSDFIINFKKIEITKKDESYNKIKADILLEAYVSK